MDSERPTILVVDDMPSNIKILTEALCDRYRIRAATTGESVQAKCLGPNKPALVLLDVVMPGMDGYEVCRRLRDHPETTDIPVIFVTGLGDATDEEKGFASGGVDYITKPLSVPLLRQRVQIHLDRCCARRRLHELNSQFARYLTPELSRSLQSGVLNAQVENRRKKLTVMFADIAGFTRQSEILAPEDLTHVLNGYFAAMANIVAKHGGTLDKYIGDAVMVFFGDPESRGPVADAEACVQMALEMQVAIEELSAVWMARGLAHGLRVRIGIATGYCTVGSFGSPHKLEYTAIGSTVNLAARLQSHARPGAVLVSDATHALAHHGFPFTPLPPIHVKGFLEPVQTYEIDGMGRGGTVSYDSPGVTLRFRAKDVAPEQRAELAELLRGVMEQLTT